MLETLMGFYSRSPDKAIPHNVDLQSQEAEYRRRKWSVFLTITFGYGFYYVCRLSFSVAKKPMADAGVFDAAQMGVIGSALFFAYAFGKLINGILADRVNIRNFMTTGLLVSAIANLCLGFTTLFWLFFLLWGFSGWFQSFGAPSSVVSLSHWFTDKERGTFYGFWSTSHNIGEAITFIGTAVVVSTMGWMWGFKVAGVLGIIVSLVIWRYLYEQPGVYGLPSPIKRQAGQREITMTAKQWAVFKNPAVWILALSSACFYVTRYAVNSWGIFFLEAEKGYTTIEASSIVSVNAVLGIIGTLFSGFLSDKLFNGRRNMPAFIFGAIYTLSIALFVLTPANPVIDIISMALFGLSLGVLLVYLGGLMAVDICSKETSGTALGIVGVASYLGAAFQDILSGVLIEDAKTTIDGQAVYNFDLVGNFWIGAAIFSMLFAALVWNVKSED